MRTLNAQVRAACYCRISSDPKDKRAGVTRQREDTAIMCEVNGWTVADFYVDNDKSVSNGRDRREDWERLLADIRAGKIDAVVVWNQDRGWRKMADLEELRPVFAQHGVKLATTNIGVIDFGNPDDIFRAQVSTAISEMEVAKMRVRQLRAARQRAEQGKPKWRKAFGYIPYTGTKEDDKGVRELDPVTAPLVRRAYAMILTGCSLGDICKLLNDAGAYGLNGRPWTATTVSLFLRSPRNAGLREYHGEIVGTGTWTPLVDETTWRAVQSILNQDSRKPGPKTVRRHLLTGLLECGKCGHHLAGQWVTQKGCGPGAHAITYACKGCRGVSVRAEHIEPVILNLVAGRLAMADAVDLLQAPQHDEERAERLRIERQTLLARRGEIADERADGLIDGVGYRRMVDRIDREIEAIDAQQVDAERARIFDGLPLGTGEVTAAIEALSPDRYREIVSTLFSLQVEPVGKGHRPPSGQRFDPDRVKVTWRV